MKKLTFTLLLGCLLFLSPTLKAQKPEGLFNLKEGDWFEVQATRSHSTNYLLRYVLQKQLANKNQQYKVSLEHLMSIEEFGDKKYFGYDSYYPPFEENKIVSENKNEFNFEVTSSGKIVSFYSSKNNTSSKVVYTAINPPNGSNAFYQYKPDLKDSLVISQFTTEMMHPVSSIIDLNVDQFTGKRSYMINEKDSISINALYLKKSRVPVLIKGSGLYISLSDASFPVTNNAIIRGKIIDQKNKAIKISMLGENSKYYFPEKNYRINDDGSFICPIFLKRPLRLKIQIGNKTLTTFIEPGDTLNISAIGHQAVAFDNDYYLNTNPNGYFTAGMNKSDYFSGSAAYNTMLSNEFDQYHNNLPYPHDAQAILTYCQKTTKAVNDLIESYRGKASTLCIDYFKRDWNYFIAFTKLNLAISSTTFIPKDYPDDYFFEVDTMSILLNPFEWNYSYQNYIRLSQLYKQLRIGEHINQKNFYYFSVATLGGYPLYRQLANSIEGKLKTELTNSNDVFDFQDFIYNCSDPALIFSLKNTRESAKQIEIGNQFPITSFVLQDSSLFNLEKYKGKPICMILYDGSMSGIKRYKEAISKFKQDEATFIIARLPFHKWIEEEEKLDSAIQKMPNVTIIDLADNDLKSKLLLEQNKIFMLDKWFRIVEKNAEDPLTNIYRGSVSKFEKSLRKTIDTKRFSKAEKTAMVKTAGWSFGSILFTFLIGLGIYRIRVRLIRAQEAVKRRIKELEIKAIRSQMNPHFIFNALNSIQSLINGNQFKEANIYLSKFAVLLRGVLNNSEKTRISLADELQAVELYCQLEQLRFEFKFAISIDQQVNCDLIEIPGMIIQPLAENAIVHGLSARGDKGQLNIRVERQNGNLCIDVSDNGIGLSPKISDSLSQKGFGLKLVEERINILNLDGKEAKLTVENNGIRIGTTATLTIPID